MPKASVAIAIIARNAEKTIGACLDSIVPHVQQVVVCIDATTTDRTAKVARKRGAKVVTGLKVSDWHECEQHGRVLAQHFANARNASFAELRKDVDWHGWCDADDVVEGGEKLAGFLAKLDAPTAGVWLPYVYSSVAGSRGREATTLFHRERLVRTNIAWHWVNRVHEVLQPVATPIEKLPLASSDEIRVVHQHQGHDTAGSAKRNTLLLEIDLEERPENNAWAKFYLGNQHYATGDFPAAIYWYEASLPNDNVYQAWQTLVYLSQAYEQIGDLDNARGAAWRAADVAPGHPEPYLRMATIYALAGDAERCEFWTRFGRSLPDAPFFAFKNPLDRTYNASLSLARAYDAAGRVSAARRALEHAAAVVPDPNVIASLEQHRRTEENATKANALATTLASVPEAERPAMWQMLNPSAEIRAFGRVRDVVVPAILKTRPNTQPRLVMWCGNPVEPWAPPSIDTTGIGGSETAAIQIARRFAADGWRVDVYNGADRYEGIHDGVGYWDLSRFGGDERADVLVSWRNPRAYGLPVTARTRLLWCHDLNSGPAVATDLPRWDRVLGVSRWHADYLARVYGLTNTDFVPNGIDLARFEKPAKKVPFRCVYASSPDRGLDRLLELWPAISHDEPMAELHVAYGWQTFDKAIASGATHLLPLKERILDLLKRTPRVVWRDRLPQSELAKLYAESYLWLYPTSFLEVSCISAMEAMAGGCVPVTSATGALPETVGDGGLVVPGSTYSQAWQEYWVSVARGALHDTATRLEAAGRGRDQAARLTWDAAYQKWIDVLKEGGVA